MKMGETSKPAFPQTPDGVTDWEKVFEDPDQGLITVIRTAQTSDNLRACMMIVIRQLFTRDNDELQVAQLTRQLDDLLAQSGGAVPTDAAIAMLRQIKVQRQELAQAYLADKKRKKRRKNRRAAGSTGTKNAIYLLFKNPKYFIGLGLILTVLLVGVIAALVIGGAHTAEDIDHAAHSAAPQEDAEDGKDAPEAKPAQQDMPLPEFKATKREATTAPAAIVLRHVTLPRSLGKWKRGPTHVMPFIFVRDEGDVANVCRQLPHILSTLNVELSKAFQDIDVFDEQVLAGVARRVGIILNARLDPPSVTGVRLAIPMDSKDYPPAKCGLASDAFAKYLK
tara:strand:+ start:217 stop:1227 length:1011 start_codon:yes stop_codon:yes gene_type:complete